MVLSAPLTTDANAEVGAIHPKTVPVILTNADEVDTWLGAPWNEACALQRPLVDGALTIIGRGQKNDGPADLVAELETGSRLENALLI